MSLEIKCAKLRFITQEMELAHAIATHAPTPFVARVVARHVLGRAQDFIAIARDVPSLLRAIGKDTRDLKARTKAYAEAFDEYYATTRTKIAAHVQDLEWVERLELWTDIEVVKLAYFVEGAREIYDAIGALSPPNFQGYAAPVESGDAAFGAMLNTVAASRPPDGLVRAGADPLAATRPDTVAVLNFSPVHQRAGQLAAINMWVHEQLGLWVAFRAFAGAERILRARILTDLVSFADCLRTRPDGDPAHRGLGLDDLLRATDGGDATAIDELRRVYRFEEMVTKLRGVRNHFGGHFHPDDALDVPALLAEFDAIQLRELAAFHARMAGVFDRSCERTMFLASYRVNNAPLAGIVRTVGQNEFVRPFDEHRDAAIPEVPRFAGAPYNVELFAEAVNAWTQEDGDPDHPRTYIWNALLQHVPPGRKHVDGGSLPEPHTYLLERLLASTDPREARRLLALVARCARGAPEPLAELLLAYLERTGECRSGALTTTEVCSALAEQPIRNADWARAPIVKLALSQEPLASALAMRWLFLRMADDPQDDAGGTIMNRLAPLLAPHSVRDRLLALLAIASLFYVRVLLATTLEREQEGVFGAVVSTLIELHQAFSTDAGAGHLLKAGDCASLSVLVGEELRASQPDDARVFYEAVTSRVVLVPVVEATRQQASLNRALAHLRIGQPNVARALALRIFDDPLAIELRAMSLLLETGLPRETVRGMLNDIKSSASLSPEQTALVADVEVELGATEGG